MNFKEKLIMKSFIILIMTLTYNYCFCCSLIKITQDGKTIVANNEDAFFPNSKMGIEPAENGKYGVIYFGNNDENLEDAKYADFRPQGGINEAGLVYDGFAVPPVKCSDAVKQPFYYDSMIKEIMKNCSDVYQVKAILEKYNCCGLGILFFVDKTGNYLVADNDSLIIGSKKNYIQTNFHPWEKTNCWRYDVADSLLNNSYEYSVNFCNKVAKAMHQEFLIGGTQYTYIADLNEGLIYLYFYRDFNEVKCFNIKEELKKGKRVIYIPDLFPDNSIGWDYVNTFNQYKGKIEKLTDSLVISNPVKLNEVKDSIRIIVKDTRFEGQSYMDMKLFSYFVCWAGNYWFYRNNYNNAFEVYSFGKEVDPNSWGNLIGVGYLYYKKDELNLAIENCVIAQGLFPNNYIVLACIDSIKNKLSTPVGMNLKMCGYYYAGDKLYVIIENKGDKYYAYCSNSNDEIELKIGEPISGKYIIMNDASVVFSDLSDSVYNRLMFYSSSEKRGYEYKRANIPLENNFKRKYAGQYAIDGNSYIDVIIDGKNSLTLNVHNADGKNDSILAYSSSTTNFVYKYGRLLFLEEDNDKFNKIQLNLDNETIKCSRTLK
jgi:hypothetical protein